MFFFTNTTASAEPAAVPRAVRFSPTEGEASIKDPRVAFALALRAPSPFPHLRAQKKFVAGRLGKSSTKIVPLKWRSISESRRTRKLLIPKGTPGVEEESATGTEREEEDARRRKTNQYYFSRAARYVRKAHFQVRSLRLFQYHCAADLTAYYHVVRR